MLFSALFHVNESWDRGVISKVRERRKAVQGTFLWIRGELHKKSYHLCDDPGGYHSVGEGEGFYDEGAPEFEFSCEHRVKNLELLVATDNKLYVPRMKYLNMFGTYM